MTKRLGTAAEVSFLQFGLAAVVGAIIAGQRFSESRLESILAAIAVVAIATLVFDLLAIVMPNLVSAPTVGWLTLPVVFTGLVAAIASLAVSLDNPLTLLPIELQGVQVWLDYRSLLTLAGALAVCLAYRLRAPRRSAGQS